MMECLLDIFNRNFNVVAADTPALMDSVYGLRYQVYCLENGYENADAHPDGLERDGFDQRAVHSLVRHRESGNFAGCVRLVLPNPDDVSTPFPIEIQCDGIFDRRILDTHYLPRHGLAEISRFAVSKTFKRRIAESPSISGASLTAVYEDQDYHSQLRRLLPHITLGLFKAIVQMSADNGISHWYAIMEPTLMRLLGRFGIHFSPIGPMVDYHGKRQPTVGSVDGILAGIYAERPDVWDIITDEGEIWPLNMSVIQPRRYSM